MAKKPAPGAKNTTPPAAAEASDAEATKPAAAVKSKQKSVKKAVKEKPAKKEVATKQKVVAANGKVNKSHEIRVEIKKLGKKARPKDIVAALTERGIKVAPAQVSMIRTKMLGKRRKKRAMLAHDVAVASSAKTTSGRPLSMADLVAAKKIAQELGGIDAALRALDALGKLR